MNCSDTHCIYKNLWYNNGRFYLLVDGKEPVVSTSHFTGNICLVPGEAS